jgi:hypothetical protein
MVRLQSFSLISTLLFSTVIQAWHIDEDCVGEKRTFIEDAIGNAFNLNTFARSGFTSASEENTQLYQFLFGTDGGTRERLGRMY